MKLLLQRKIFNKTNCIGELFINEKWFCYILEDIIRGKGSKIKGETAIPAGNYFVEVTMSNRFKKRMPLVYNTSDFKVVANGKTFEGVRFHNGLNETHSEGCLLTGYKTNGLTISGKAGDDLTKLLDNKENHNLRIQNKIFSEGLNGKIE